MPTAAKIGYGITFGVESATPGTYTSLGELTAVTPPALTRETVDATHMTSANRVREKIAGLRDSGEASIEINYVPGEAATWDVLKAAYDADAPKNYKITFANNESVIFPALITEISTAAPMNDRMTLTAKFVLTGAPTWS